MDQTQVIKLQGFIEYILSSCATRIVSRVCEVQPVTLVKFENEGTVIDDITGMLQEHQTELKTIFEVHCI